MSPFEYMPRVKCVTYHLSSPNFIEMGNHNFEDQFNNNLIH